MALVRMGVSRFSDVAARYAADELFSEIHEIGVRDGADLVVDGYDFAPTFSIWTTIEECLNPPVVYERAREVHDRAVQRAGTVHVPGGSVRCSASTSSTRRSSSCRWINVDRVTFKYGLGEEFIDVLRRSEARTALDHREREGRRGVLRRGGGDASDPAPSATRCTAARAPARGSAAWQGREPRGVRVSHRRQRLVDREFGHQAVVWQTAVMPAVAIELMRPAWSGIGIVGPGRCRRSSTSSTSSAASGSGRTTSIASRCRRSRRPPRAELHTARPTGSQWCGSTTHRPRT